MKTNKIFALAIMLPFLLLMAVCDMTPSFSGRVWINNLGDLYGFEGQKLRANYDSDESATFQWYRGGRALPGETWQTCVAVETGEYTVSVAVSGYKEKMSHVIIVLPVRSSGSGAGSHTGVGGTGAGINFGPKLNGNINIEYNDPAAGRGPGTSIGAVYDGDEPVTYQWYYDTDKMIPGAAGKSPVLNPRTDGTYTLVVTSTDGSASTSITVQVDWTPPPVLDAGVQGAIMITGGAPSLIGAPLTALYTGGAGAPMFQWYKDGELLVGETGVTCTPSEPGTYTVSVSNGVATPRTSAPEKVYSTVTFVTQGGTAVTTQYVEKNDTIDTTNINTDRAVNDGANYPRFRGWLTAADFAAGNFYDLFDFTTHIKDDLSLWADWGYREGETGPAGGIIFYRETNPLGFTLDGPGIDCYYLEAYDSSTTNRAWSSAGRVDVPGTDVRLGYGWSNTSKILTADLGPGNFAAREASNPRNGFNDWFLPSRDELDILAQNRDYVGGFANSVHWASSQEDADNAHTQQINTSPDPIGAQLFTFKDIPGINRPSVRPIRAF